MSEKVKKFGLHGASGFILFYRLQSDVHQGMEMSKNLLMESWSILHNTIPNILQSYYLLLIIIISKIFPLEN